MKNTELTALCQVECERKCGRCKSAQPTPTSNAGDAEILVDEIYEKCHNSADEGDIAGLGSFARKKAYKIVERFLKRRAATAEADLAKAREVIAELLAALEQAPEILNEARRGELGAGIVKMKKHIDAALQSASAFIGDKKDV